MRSAATRRTTQPVGIRPAPAEFSARPPRRLACSGLRARQCLDRVFVDLDESVVASDRSSVTLVRSDGTRIEEPTTTALGAPENPLDDGALIEKFNELAALVLDTARVRRVVEATLALDELADARALIGLLRAEGPTPGSAH